MFSNYSVRKPYTVIVAVIIIAILGAISFMNISTDLLPSVNLPYSVVITSYIGASPEEVEMAVTRPIEQRMASISNIKNVSSVSRENMSIVILEFGESTNMDSAVIEMRESLDMIKRFMPETVGTSTIMKINPDMMPVMVLSAAVKGQEIGTSSAFLETKIIPELESIEGVASVEASGLIENQVHIIIRQDKLDKVNENIKETMMAAAIAQMPIVPAPPTVPIDVNNPNASSIPTVSEPAIPVFPEVVITKEMISGILKGQNFSMPSGYITEEGVDYLVRTGDKFADLESLESLTVMVMPIPGIDPIKLSDVAEIINVNNSGDRYSKVNGNDAITMTIQKQTEYVTSDISKSIQAKIVEINKQYPDVEIVALMDQGEYIDIVVNSLSLNLIFGGLLAIVILLLFLRDLKPTIIVGFAIPISLVAAFTMMYFGDITLNIISMGGLALGVGMLVDNSIVVIENIYRMRNEGKNAIEAAVEGAKQVSGAITASTLTTVAVFIPIVFVQGFTREIFTDMGLTIAFSLLASLVIALTLVPMMASRILVGNIKNDHPLFEKIKVNYTKVLNFGLNHKLIVIVTVLLLFGGSIFGALQMGTELFPSSDSGQLSVNLTMPRGSLFDETTAVADEVMNKILTIEGVESVGASMGGGGIGMGFGGGGSGDSSVTFYVTLKDDRSLSTDEISQIVREKTLSSDYEVSVSGTDMNLGAMTGGAIDIEVRGRDFAALEKIAKEIAGIVATVDGTMDISSGIEETAPELRLVVDKDLSIASGLTVAQVFMEVNKQLSNDVTATTIDTGTTTYDIIVKDESGRESVTKESLLDYSIVTPLGKEVLIRDIASLEESRGFSSINRSNQQRYVTVTGALKDGYNVGLVSTAIEEKLKDYIVPDGYSVEMVGQNMTITESFKDLFLMLLLAVAFIYLIMVAQFQSLLSPFIVMFTIPLAFTGGFIGLMLTGNPVSLVAFVGLIILAGVVVNNGIVFVDYVNKMRESGLSKRDALVKTGNDRLRPILMTALTTIFALSTMSVGAGTGTELMQPMAITAIGGLLYATLLTLVLIPVLYDVMHPEA